MKFLILHKSLKRIRIRTSINLNIDVQNYLLSSTKNFKKIINIHFYNDLNTFSIITENASYDEAIHYLKSLDKNKLISLSIKSFDKVNETPFSIVSSALIKRILFKTFMPSLVKIPFTIYKSIYYVKNAYNTLKDYNLTMEVLDGTSIVILLLTNQFNTASSVMFLLNLGDRLENWTKKKSFDDLEKSLELSVKDVFVYRDNEKKQIPLKDVILNDIVIVSEGNEILFDGEVVSGKGSVNESSLTGEFFPVLKEVHDRVSSNTILEKGELYVRISNIKVNAHIHALIDLMKKTDALKNTKHYSFIAAADKLVKYNFLGAFITFIITRSFSRAISFLLVDYSCSLKLSIPIIYLSSIRELINKGIVVKNISSLDNFLSIDTYVFDKTGTITDSTPLIYDIIPFYGYKREEVLKIGACLEEHVYHPIANALVNRAKIEGVDHKNEIHTSLKHIASRGIISTIDEETVVIGNLLLMEEENISLSDDQLKKIKELEDIYNLLYLGYKKKLIAIFCVSISLVPSIDKILTEIKSSYNNIKQKKLVLLTGDKEKRTKRMVSSLPFDEIHAEMTPITKHKYILSEKKAGRKTLMIGDGINDSAALSASDISISMEDGADITKQVSDILLRNGSIKSLITLRDMSIILSKRVNRNIFTSATINTSLIIFGLFNILPGSTLSILHNFTTFTIILSSFSIKED